MEQQQCATCLIWQYLHSDFSEPEGKRMTGWCRALTRNTKQDFVCSSFTSKAAQEREYLARNKAKSLT